MQDYGLGKRAPEQAIIALKYAVAGNKVLRAARRMQVLLRKAGFKPDQPRVPRGEPRGGQWTRVADAQVVPTPRTKPRAVAAPTGNAPARDTEGKIQQLTYETVRGGQTMASWSIRWKLSGASPKGGYVIQEVRTTYHIKDINTGEAETREVHFWEAWKVSPGKQITDSLSKGKDHDDIFGLSVDFYNTTGRIDTFVSARFHEGAELPAHFTQNNPKTFAGPLLSTTQDPSLSSDNTTEAVERTYETNW